MKNKKSNILNKLFPTKYSFPAFIFILGLVIVVFSENFSDFQANILNGPTSAPFNGTVEPIKKVPNWVKLSSSEWKMSYNDIPISKLIALPTYTPSNLVIPFDSLDFSDSHDQQVRNEQVTFSTPYMGNYKLDGREYAGSHLAVDIKIPSGTPVYSIANGVVVKAASQSSGFGTHLVVRHDNVPSIINSNTKVDYYSGYAHLSSFLVKEGSLVSKGQLIGYSGASGLVTTPHLHFQIDTDEAPWHPFWPFTSAEASNAGLSFWEGVNAGLGKDVALKSTINPMIWVQKYKNFANTEVNIEENTDTGNVTDTPDEPDSVIDSSNSEDPDGYLIDNSETNETVVDDDPDNGETDTNTVNVEPNPGIIIPESVSTADDFELKVNDSFTVGSELKFKVLAVDGSGDIIEKFKPEGDVYILLENGSAKIKRSYLNANDFENGVAEFSITPTASYGIRLKVIYNDISKYSNIVKESLFLDVDENDENYVAINFLKNNNVVRGYPDGTFKPEQPVSRVESLKFIYEGLNKEGVRSNVVLEFTDTDSKAWYARYVAAAYNEGVIQGFPGRLFKPADSVTRAEFVKMVLEASDFEARDFVPKSNIYTDVKKGDWYYGYVNYAREMGVLDTSSNKFRPNVAMTRAEVSDLLYKMILLKVSGSDKYEDALLVDASDVLHFYQKI